jgi:uncharacterized protein (TIGR00730 family)
MKALNTRRHSETEFLTSTPADETWRVFKIMSEFVEGFETMRGLSPAVSVFGSARLPESDPMYPVCVQLAEKLARAGFAIITGGGPGAMEAANRGAQLGGAPSIGLNIELPQEQLPNPYQDVSLYFRYFFARKVMFVKYAMAFVIMPGGFGTLDEVFESLTLIQTEKVGHFPVILIGRAYWSGLIEWLKDKVVKEGKIDARDLDLFTCTDDPDEVLRIIKQAWEDQKNGLLTNGHAKNNHL